MPEVQVKKAGYVSAPNVTGPIARYRDIGLTTPFTAEVLAKAGVPETLGPRTLMAFRLLNLIDKDGYPTDQFEKIKHAAKDELQGVLEQWVRGAYADIFQFVDPATEPERVEDAFRGYEPHAQRAKMVSLFMGLCAFAGIIEQPKTGRVVTTSDGRKFRVVRSKPKAQEPTPKTPAGKNAGGGESQSGDLTPAREEYARFLLERAKDQKDLDPDLLDRIERALGYGGSP